MYLTDQILVLSPTDLTAFLACEHLTQLERRVATGVMARPERQDPDLEVLRRHGDIHEAGELARLVALGRSVVEIEKSGPARHDLIEAERATLAAMQSGADVIYQASFFDGRWMGRADFLLRVEEPSLLGEWSYEAVDTKLARRAKPAALVQLCSYSEHVARLQGRWPDCMEVVTGDQERHRHRVDDTLYYYRAAKARLEATLATGQGAGWETVSATYPHPVPHCALCPWLASCDERRRADDHLSLVAGMRSDMVAKWAGVGVTTARQLATDEVGGEVPKMGLATADRLRHQARLQVAYQDDGVVRHEILPDDGPLRGLASLPEPSPGDLFFDLEGDPWAEGGGLEYLFGWTDAGGEYQCLWAHHPVDERKALEAFVDMVTERLTRYPDLHVYHYAPYEVTAVKRLMGRYATREAEVDQLLRGEVFVDLFRVAKQSVRISEEGYGLKKLENLYAFPRVGDIADGATSVAVYETWLENGDSGLLDEIRAYNRLDCLSTFALRDWLEALRQEAGVVTRPAAPDREAGSGARDAHLATAALAERLSAGLALDRAERDAAGQGTWLLAQLLGWHRREDKPAWWEYYDRLKRSDAELASNSDCIGELEYVGVVGEVGRSLIHRYSFDPSQEYKLAVGSKPIDPATKDRPGVIVALDSIAGTVDLKRSVTSQVPHPRSLVPNGPPDSKVLQDSLTAMGTWVLENGLLGPGPYQAVRDLLAGRPPRVRGIRPGAALVEAGEEGQVAARRLVHDLDGACLPVHGPPGSGKTFTGSDMVVDLVVAGRRVGITGPSHKVIANLLEAVCERAVERGVAIRLIQKVSNDEQGPHPLVKVTDENKVIVAALAAGEVDVVAGTAWLWARTDMRDSVDTLFLDEAGQLSLANVAAVSGAARNVVLLGDPRQLAQPSRGSHPPGSEVSALDHVLGGGATMPAERGVFLRHTYRMHPEVCRFVSILSYDGQLESDASAEKQEVEAGPLVGGVGLRWVPVPHEGNRNRSSEEGAVVVNLVNALRGRPFTDEHGQSRDLALDDILVITPYNGQVVCLAEALPAGTRVGTVDKFQGQEAPVVIYSLAASSAEDVPRGLEFLLSMNRLNVAISRARALAIVVASPTLLQARCRTVGQLERVSALCRLVETAGSL